MSDDLTVLVLAALAMSTASIALNIYTCRLWRQIGASEERRRHVARLQESVEAGRIQFRNDAQGLPPPTAFRNDAAQSQWGASRAEQRERAS